MPQSNPRFHFEYLAKLRASYSPASVDVEGLLHDDYLLAQDDRYSVFYAPVDTLPAREAKIIFVGLTPGFAQVQLAAEAFASMDEATRQDPILFAGELRRRVAFAGDMRTNLCAWLDELEVPQRLNRSLGLSNKMEFKQSCDFFERDTEMIATTSALLYPVFKGSDRRVNFSGVPELAKIAIFSSMIEELLAPRLARASGALIVPLGRSANSAIEHLCVNRGLSRDRVLTGLPHPSGANGHRKTQFEDPVRRATICDKLDSFFDRIPHPAARAIQTSEEAALAGTSKRKYSAPDFAAVSSVGSNSIEVPFSLKGPTTESSLKEAKDCVGRLRYDDRVRLARWLAASFDSTAAKHRTGRYPHPNDLRPILTNRRRTSVAT